MKWKSFGWFQVFLLCFLLSSFAWARTYRGSYLPREATHSINIRYKSTKRFPSLQKKVGATVGLAPVRDSSHGRLYVGHYVYQRVSNNLRGEPFPLENTIRDSLIHLLSLHGIKTVPIPNWNGKEESLKNIGADSILMIEIRRFWAEGTVSARGAKVNTSIYLTLRLGVKKEGRVFRRDVYTVKENKVVGLTPAEAEQGINQALAEILDTYFSKPY